VEVGRERTYQSSRSDTGYPFDPEHVGYYRGEYRGRRIKGGGFTARKAFLIFLLIACLVAAIYTGYLLFTHKTDLIIGIIILAVDIGVLIWNISLLRKWRVRARTIVAIAVIIAVLGATTGALAGVAPLANAKDRLVGVFGNLDLGSSSELKTTIMGFEARRQPPDISEVVFMVFVDPTDNTVKGAEYTVELLLEGQVSDSVKVVVTESGSVTPVDVYLKGHGPVMNKMLLELDEKYEAAKSEYEEFEVKHFWDIITGHEQVPSWEGLKELEEEEDRLRTEMNRWRAWRNGEPLLGHHNEFDNFCRNYVKLSVGR